MTDFLFQMGLSNACFSIALAIVAMVVGATARRPHLAYMLWLLVFVKLVTPPIVTIPVGMPSQIVSNDDLSAETELPVVSDLDVETQSGTALTAPPSLLSRIAAKLNTAKPWLASIWLLGSLLIVAWSVRRVFQFARLLRENTGPAPHVLQSAAATIAKQLELNNLPAVLTTSAQLSPMVWWAGGKVRVVFPASLLDEMDASEWRWVLAHELAHVRRRDHLVRWLEWLACACFWWNPVVWWAQRNLRRTEEICCDALVLSCLKPKPRSYADSLLTAVEFLACPAIRPPAMASEINSGGFLERRFRMIVSESPYRVKSRWLQACVLLCAFVVLPLGLAYAQDYEAVGKRLRAAVEAGELTGEQARIMLGTLRKAGDAKKEAATPDAKLVATWEKLQAMVKAGELTEEQAKAKMAAIKKEAAKSDIDTQLEATWEKLQAGVKAGQLTEQQAEATMAAIKKRVAKSKQEAEKMREHLTKVREELETLFEAGKISREDLINRYEGALKAVRERMEAEQEETRANETREYLMNLRKKIGAEVEAGKISEEDAKKRYEGAEKAINEGKKMTAHLKKVKEELDAHVEAGKTSREDATKRYEGALKEARKRMEAGQKEPRANTAREYLMKMREELGAAVKAGKISEEDAAKRLEAAEKAIKEKMATGSSERGSKRFTPEDLSRAGIEIRKAVAEGKISEEEGRKKMEAMRKMMAAPDARGERSKRGGDARPDWEAIKKRIEGAVESGKMTREEADAKYKEIREKHAKERGGKR